MANNTMTKNQYTPRRVSHPGATLAAKLQEMGMSIREFAVRATKPEKTILAVIKGDSSITPDMAVIFETVTSIPAHFWMSRQRNFDEYQARQRMEQRIAESKEWADSFPIDYMVNYGWVPAFSDDASKTKSLLQFFAVNSPEAWENYYFNQQLKVAFRISLRSTAEPYSISAWLRQGDRQAESVMLNVEYSDKTLKATIPLMKQLMVAAPKDWTIQLQHLCAQCGIKLIYTTPLPNAPIIGATRWIASKHPCIQMAIEGIRYDVFWFSFFHEVAHILLHGKKDFFLENVEYDNKEMVKEQEADTFSANILLSPEQESEIIVNNDFTQAAIKEYALKYGTHPSIIIGRLLHRRILPQESYPEYLN